METCETVPAIRAAVARTRAGGARVALVPTMGALHRGHMALVAEARGRVGPEGAVVASIFVNPTQFGDPRDLAAYPRTLEADRAMLEGAGADLLFLPSVAEMYPEGDETVVETARLAGLFHGAVRPGHFRGVATVVCKLLHIVGPDVALFGEKDYQQLAVIRRMTRDLFLPVEIAGVPTVREADGLALSSRNVRLGPEDRAAAPVLNRALDHGAELLRQGRRADLVEEAIRVAIEAEPRARDARVDIVRSRSFEPAGGSVLGPGDAEPFGIMVSARFGEVLLIDQREVEPPPVPAAS